MIPQRQTGLYLVCTLRLAGSETCFLLLHSGTFAKIQVGLDISQATCICTALATSKDFNRFMYSDPTSLSPRHIPRARSSTRV